MGETSLRVDSSLETKVENSRRKIRAARLPVMVLVLNMSVPVADAVEAAILSHTRLQMLGPSNTD